MRGVSQGGESGFFHLADSGAAVLRCARITVDGEA
jgi:hypothetical protein